jgi:HK97 family phage prohead protease
MADVDNSAWDGNAAMSSCSSAADYRSICAGEKTAGSPDERQHWALPHHKRPGAAPNAAGVRNALSRLPQTQGLKNKQAAQAHLDAHMRVISPAGGANSVPVTWMAEQTRKLGKVSGEERTVVLPDPLAVTGHGDGLTFEGFAAVYNTPTRITGWEGDFDEQIAPGAFRAVTSGDYPVLMFEHGRHPLIGTMPLGVLTDARDDERDGTFGLWVEGRLTDNWLIQPVRDAVHDKAVTGMSFRFFVLGDDGDSWTDRAGDVPLRTLLSLDVPELGPVVFPAYEPTTASVRSALDKIKLPVAGRPQAGARAAADRAGGTAGQPALPSAASARFAADGDSLRLRGIIT